VPEIDDRLEIVQAVAWPQNPCKSPSSASAGEPRSLAAIMGGSTTKGLQKGELWS
jgi:hypothetical protein